MRSRTHNPRATSSRVATKGQDESLARPASRTRLEREIELKRQGAGEERQAPSAASILDFVDPELYERNAFRLLEVSTDLARVDPEVAVDLAATAESERAHRRLRLFPLSVKASEARLDSARACLRHPQRRLLHELFWFWSQESGDLDDEALRLLERQDVKACGQLWLRQEKQGHHDCVATHNLAVLYHLSALNVERELATGEVDDRRYRFGVSCWGESLSRWARLLVHDGFWSRVKARAERFLGILQAAEFTERLREVLPKALLKIHVELAARALGDGRFRDFQNHKRLLESCSLRDFGSSDDLIEELLRPRIDALWEACDLLEDAEAAEESAGSDVREVIEDVDHSLQLIDGLLREDSPERVLSHDRAARAVLDWLVKEPSASVGDLDLKHAFERAVSWTDDAPLRRSLQVALDRAREQSRLAACPFTGESPPDPAASLVVWLHGDVRMELSFEGGARRAWEERRVTVPRSRRARRLHIASRVSAWVAASGVVVASLFLGAGLMVSTGAVPAWMPAAALVTVSSWVQGLGLTAATVGACGWAAAWIAGRWLGIRPLSAARRYPPIAQLLEAGWRRGRRPSRFRSLELS